jgi:hypothetical protein
MGVPSFYQEVMSTPLAKVIPKNTAPPAKNAKGMIKSKGKKGEPKKLKGAFSADKIDLFRTFLEADAGKEGEQQHHHFFEVNLKKLSQLELEKLSKKIDRLRSACLEESEDFQVMDSLYQRTLSAIEYKLRKSNQALEDVKKKIIAHLQPMLPLEAKISGPNTFVFTSSRCIRLAHFTKKHFSTFIEEYDQLVSTGVVIPAVREEKGIDFVKHTIFPYLHLR